jgi:RIO kinase 1
MASSHRSRRRFDDDDFDGFHPSPTIVPVEATRGPSPCPEWVIHTATAVDTDLGVLKSGKEADVALVRRDDADRCSLMALKRYRDAHHRLFHRDATYLEGRRMRRSRENRAMDTRTAFGRELIAGQWAVAEFRVLSRLWTAGAAVPYPVQLAGTELLMEFIGDADGTAAPRLAQLHPTSAEARDLFAQLRSTLLLMAEAGYAHGDLSAYNVLVHDGRLVVIDVPQAVDLAGNPQGSTFLQRDCTNICTWFDARGVDADADELARELLAAIR